PLTGSSDMSHGDVGLGIHESDDPDVLGDFSHLDGSGGGGSIREDPVDDSEDGSSSDDQEGEAGSEFGDGVEVERQFDAVRHLLPDVDSEGEDGSQELSGPLVSQQSASPDLPAEFASSALEFSQVARALMI
ncbi:unnamed protein product, partial [Tilletia laevis]